MDYEKELFAQKAPYLQWLKQQEAELAFQYRKPSNNTADFGKQIFRLPFSSCLDCVKNVMNGMDVASDSSVIYFFTKTEGMLSQYALPVLLEAFSANEQAVFAYADEDYSGSLKELYNIEKDAFEKEITQQYHFGDKEYFRGEPWLKPDFSPDTLESFFYIGSFFAIKGCCLRYALEKYGDGISLYGLVYLLLMEMCKDRMPQEAAKIIVHVPRVLYTNNSLGACRELPGLGEIRENVAGAEAAGSGNAKVSIIIPSKDHAHLLETCVKSLIKYTNYRNYELIIVDNGSCEEQRMCIRHFLDRMKAENKDMVIKYLYEEMDFNFSSMCNSGAQAAEGEYLLFLNDDIEIMDTKEGKNWLGYMLAYAVKASVGAVGAKLYYPKVGCQHNDRQQGAAYTIQHAGITNMAIGPAHKLGGMEDKGCLYHGHNSVNYDMLAVTAACMLIRRALFARMGGFDEAFAVAYNDVELCFRLYEAGFYNVQVNDAVLIHHESLSRGQDSTPEKQKRLAQEKEKLYEKHMLLKNKDPFYHPNLVQWKKDTAYHIGYAFPFDMPVKPQQPSVKRCNVVKKQYADYLKYSAAYQDNKDTASKRLLAKVYFKVRGYDLPMLRIDSIEYEENLAVIKGWYVLQRHDNASLERKIWLIRITRDADYLKAYEFVFLPQLREDAAALFVTQGDTANTELAGIHLIVDTAELMKGAYMLCVLAKSGKKTFAAFAESAAGKWLFGSGK